MGAEVSHLKSGWVLRNFDQQQKPHHLNLKDKSDLELHSDVIVAVDRQPVETNIDKFLESVQTKDSVDLLVYNLRDRDYREITVQNELDAQNNPKKMGIRICLDTIENLEKNIFHILSVDKNGPGFDAGLVADEDYIVYIPPSKPEEIVEPFTFIRAHDQRKLKLVVYNSKRDTYRVVEIFPRIDWGGNGSLGCEIGTGMIHTLPPRGKNVVQLDGNETKTSKVVAEFENPELVGYNSSVELSSYEQLLAKYKYHYEMARKLEAELMNLSMEKVKSNPNYAERPPSNHLQNSSPQHFKPYAINQQAPPSQQLPYSYNPVNQPTSQPQQNNNHNLGPKSPQNTKQKLNNVVTEDKIYAQYQKDFPWFKDKITPKNQMNVYTVDVSSRPVKN